MKTIAEVLSRDLTRRIEEVIQVDQAEDQAVFAEIDEYIATDSIRDLYARLLKAIAEAPSDPNEAIGVWVSEVDPIVQTKKERSFATPPGRLPVARHRRENSPRPSPGHSFSPSHPSQGLRAGGRKRMPRLHADLPPCA